MGGAQRALDSQTRLRGKGIAVGGLKVVDEDFVEEKLLRVDEARVEECFQQVADAIDDLGVCKVLLGKGGGILTQLDFLGDNSGSEALMVAVVFATQRSGAVSGFRH